MLLALVYLMLISSKNLTYLFPLLLCQSSCLRQWLRSFWPRSVWYFLSLYIDFCDSVPVYLCTSVMKKIVVGVDRQVKWVYVLDKNKYSQWSNSFLSVSIYIISPFLTTWSLSWPILSELTHISKFFTILNSRHLKNLTSLSKNTVFSYFYIFIFRPFFPIGGF